MHMQCTCMHWLLPSKCSVSIHYSERIKTSVHHLVGGEQVLHHWNTEVCQQQSKANVNNLPDVVTWEWVSEWASGGSEQVGEFTTKDRNRERRRGQIRTLERKRYASEGRVWNQLEWQRQGGKKKWKSVRSYEKLANQPMGLCVS